MSHERAVHNRRFRRLADLLAEIGQPCWVCRSTAAALHRLDGYELEAPFTIAVGAGRVRPCPPHALEPAPALARGDTVVVNGVPVTSPARTLLDLAAAEPPARLASAVGSALARGVSSADELHRRLVAARHTDAAAANALLRAVVRAEGEDTFVERRFLAGVAAAGLPRPAVDRSIAKAGSKVRIRCRFPPSGVEVELFGYTLRRAPRPPGAAAVHAPIRVHYLDLVERPAECVAAVVAAVRAWWPQTLRVPAEG